MMIAKILPHVVDLLAGKAVGRGVGAKSFRQRKAVRPGRLLVDEAELLRLLFRLDRLDAEPEGLVGDLCRFAGDEPEAEDDED